MTNNGTIRANNGTIRANNGTIDANPKVFILIRHLKCFTSI